MFAITLVTLLSIPIVDLDALTSEQTRALKGKLVIGTLLVPYSKSPEKGATDPLSAKLEKLRIQREDIKGHPEFKRKLIIVVGVMGQLNLRSLDGLSD